MYKKIQTLQMLFNTDAKIIKKSKLFDATYYLQTYHGILEEDTDPLTHFVKYGWKEGRNPSEDFNTNFYVTAYPDVALSKINPLVHYIKFGENEGKRINNLFQSLSFKKSLVTSPTKTLKKTIYTILENQNIIFEEKTNITIISTEYTLFVVHLLYKQLTEDGFDVQIKTTLPENFSDNLHIVICPQIFDRLPNHYIAFQMEQLESSTWFNARYRKILKNSIAIFDYSIQNIEYLHNNNAFSYKQLFFLPISLFEGYQQFLIQEGYWDACKSDTYDVLFYGSTHSERRQNYLHTLQDRFSVKVIDGAFGNGLYKELLSAKVIVNIHFFENALLETTRLYECLSLGLSVVSEESIDMEEHSELLGKIDFVRIGDIDHMINRIENILAKRNNHA